MRRQSHKFGLRTVAVVEASKGVAVLALCVALLSLLHKDLVDVVDHLTVILRLNPDSRLADWAYDLADRTTGRGIWTAFTVGCVYASGRFLEAYGLWNQRSWGEWLSVITGGIYLPFELYALVRHPNWANALLLIGNLLVVLYILSILAENRRLRAAAARAALTPASSSAASSPRENSPGSQSCRLDCSSSAPGTGRLAEPSSSSADCGAGDPTSHSL